MKESLTPELRDRAHSQLGTQTFRLDHAVQFAQWYMYLNPLRPKTREEVAEMFPIPPNASEDRIRHTPIMIEEMLETERTILYPQRVTKCHKRFAELFASIGLSEPLVTEIVNHLLSD